MIRRPGSPWTVRKPPRPALLAALLFVTGAAAGYWLCRATRVPVLHIDLCTPHRPPVHNAPGLTIV